MSSEVSGSVAKAPEAACVEADPVASKVGPAPTVVPNAKPKADKKDKKDEPLTEAQRLLLKFSTPQPKTKGKAALPEHLQKQIERQKNKSEKEINGDTYSYTKTNKRGREVNVWQRMAVKSQFDGCAPFVP